MQKLLFGLILLAFATCAEATLVIPMHWTSGTKVNQSLGVIRADDTPFGLLLTPNLSGLTPGAHGFHVHVMPLCDDEGKAAGGHLDPRKIGIHLGPYSGEGHLGDLPVLIVGDDGRATLPVLAPRLKLKQLNDHSLVIHAGFDDYY